MRLAVPLEVIPQLLCCNYVLFVLVVDVLKRAYLT